MHCTFRPATPAEDKSIRLFEGMSLPLAHRRVLLVVAGPPGSGGAPPVVQGG
jgi:hypothetical protein